MSSDPPAERAEAAHDAISRVRRMMWAYCKGDPSLYNDNDTILEDMIEDIKLARGVRLAFPEHDPNEEIDP